MNEICTDNRFEVIAAYKKKLMERTNIETSPDEMAVIDNVLFRFWQMGWLPPVPHGRLIDADALEDGWIWGTTDRLGRCECVERWQIQNAPTIIPADGEKGEE